MTTTRLSIYNGALLLLGELRLANLSENREPRYLLDSVWNKGGVRYCLEQGQWHFAMRTSQFSYNPDITPAFGLNRAFDKPTDWVSTSGIFQDEFLRTPLLDYADEASQWFSSVDDIYVRYVSDHANYGTNYSNWPVSFTEYVEAYFAGRVVHKIPSAAAKIQFLLGPPGREDKGWVNRCLLIAKNKSAMAQPTTFPSRGTWARARHAGMNRSYRDGGNTSSLIG